MTMTEDQKTSCPDALMSARYDEIRSTLMPERNVVRQLRNRAWWCRFWAFLSILGIAACVLCAIGLCAYALFYSSADDALNKVLSKNNNFKMELDGIEQKLDVKPPATEPSKEAKMYSRPTLEKAIEDYNNLLKDGVDASNSPLSAHNLPLLAWRLSAVTALLFLVKILVPLQQRYERLSSLHDTQADVLQLLPYPDAIPLDSWIRLFPVDVLNFGKAPKTPADQVIDGLKDVAIAAVNKSGGKG